MNTKLPTTTIPGYRLKATFPLESLETMLGSNSKKGSNNNPIDVSDTPHTPEPPSVSTMMGAWPATSPRAPSADIEVDTPSPSKPSSINSGHPPSPMEEDQVVPPQSQTSPLQRLIEMEEEKKAREKAEDEAQVTAKNFEMQMLMISQILEQSQAKFSQHIQSQMERSEQSQSKANQNMERIVGGVANQLDETNHQIKILHERMNNLEDDRRSRRSHSASSKHSKKEKPDEPLNSSSPISPFLRALENLQSHDIEQEPTTSQNVNISNDNGYLSFARFARPVGIRPSPPKTQPRLPEKTPAPIATSEPKPSLKPTPQIPTNPNPLSNPEEFHNTTHPLIPNSDTEPDEPH